MVEIGQPAPDFKLADQNQQEVTLGQFSGQKHVVLSFHVSSFTGG